MELLDTPWGQVKLYTSRLPISPADFDLAPHALCIVANEHFDLGHTVYVTNSALGPRLIDCSCGAILADRESADADRG